MDLQWVVFLTNLGATLSCNETNRPREKEQKDKKCTCALEPSSYIYNVQTSRKQEMKFGLYNSLNIDRLSSFLVAQGSVKLLGVLDKYKKLKQIDFSRLSSSLGVQGP